MKLNNKKIKSQKGMTLIETIVALGILVTGLVASLTLMISTIHFTKQAERAIVVVNLAREGVEIVRTLRDYGKTIDVDSFENLGTGNFVVEVESDGTLSKESAYAENIENCDNCKIYIKDDKYTHDTSGTQTAYRRLITISDVVAGQEKKIISEVYWTDRNNSYDYQLEARLTNW